MEYDYNRNRSGQHPMYRPPPPSSQPSPMYPKIGPHPQSAVNRPSPYHQNPHPPSSAASGGGGGLGIRVTIKPQYKITPPPHLSPYGADIPRSSFQFDFGLEKKILAESHKDNPNWTKFGIENFPTKQLSQSTSSSKFSASNPVESKYIAMGLNREAVSIAVANYGDNPAKVQEFVNGYTLLHEMGFSSNSVAEALIMHDNDTDKALAHFLSGSS
ncbi:PREDICTED: uncharacterized protein LOC109344342 isoform X1 [Lupinus angustifolius]|uniref:uncharacterized protein LOC109344342 isoform X1 n=1 Tax=Lupinus angustifolius TaxID=3871 RepID=UPI00092EB415|nr:PREDICTED: uncharacterized protein LOC109344342 isoform X1 [Lupinus angustifolius]